MPPPRLTLDALACVAARADPATAAVMGSLSTELQSLVPPKPPIWLPVRACATYPPYPPCPPSPPCPPCPASGRRARPLALRARIGIHGTRSLREAAGALAHFGEILVDLRGEPAPSWVASLTGHWAEGLAHWLGGSNLPPPAKRERRVDVAEWYMLEAQPGHAPPLRAIHFLLDHGTNQLGMDEVILSLSRAVLASPNRSPDFRMFVHNPPLSPLRSAHNIPQSILAAHTQTLADDVAPDDPPPLHRLCVLLHLPSSVKPVALGACDGRPWVSRFPMPLPDVFLLWEGESLELAPCAASPGELFQYFGRAALCMK